MVANYAKSIEVQKFIDELIEKLPQFSFISKEDVVGMIRESEKCSYKACIFKIPTKLSSLLENPYELGIIVWKEAWTKATESLKYLLIYHELLHIAEGKNGYKLKKHDIEDWKEIIKNAGIDWEKPECIFDLIKRK